MLACALASICLLTPSTGAFAVPILQGPASAATGISGLDIAGTVYDVTFSNFGSFNARGENPPTFLGDQTGAQAAESAIAAFLTSEVVTGITNLGTGAPVWLLVIPYELDATNFLAEAVRSDPPYNGTWTTTTGTGGSRASNFGNVSWVSFTAQAPEPTTLLLVCAGLSGIGFFGRRAAAQV